MGQLMSDDIERNREAVENRPIAIAEHHLLAIPEGVVVLLPIMHRCVERQALSIDRIALINLEVKVERMTEAVISFVNLWIASAGLSFCSYQATGQIFAAVRRVNGAMHLRLGGADSTNPRASH